MNLFFKILLISALAAPVVNAGDSVFIPPSDLILGELVMYEKGGAFTEVISSSTNELSVAVSIPNPMTGGFDCPRNEGFFALNGFHDPAFELYEAVLISSGFFSDNPAGGTGSGSPTIGVSNHYECELTPYGNSWYWWAVEP